jgi:hypothetical protein
VGGSAGSSALYAKTVEGSSFFAAVREAGRSPRDQPPKMKLGHIKPANTNIDHTNRIVLAYPIFQAFRNQRDLLAIHFHGARSGVRNDETQFAQTAGTPALPHHLHPFGWRRHELLRNA